MVAQTLVWVALGLLTAFLVVYLAGWRWWRSPVARQVATLSVSLWLLFASSGYTIVFVKPLPGALILVEFGLLCAALAWQLLLALLYRFRARPPQDGQHD